MDNHEIRAIRGGLSRAAFARLLGVTSLTVLRWELPDDNKEARRPRARMVEALLKLKQQGVGAGTAGSSNGDDSSGAEDSAETAEEILETLGTPTPSPEVSAAFANDRGLVQPLLDRLMSEAWPAAEDELLRLLHSQALESAHGRTLATLGLLQVQILVRLDVRGGLMTLTPILDEVERGTAPQPIAARAHLLAALLFGAPDSRFFDVGRVNAHAARADALLGRNENDLRVLLATARIASARFLGPSVVLHAYRADLESLERADASLPRFLAHGLHGLMAGYRDEVEAATRHDSEGLAIAERLGLWPIVIAILADRALRAVNGATVPEKVLEIVQTGRRAAKNLELPPGEPMLRLLASEVEALSRLARFEEAEAVVQEANALAQRGGIPRYALAMPVLRLYLFTNRSELLPAWAEALDAETAGSSRPLANVHAIAVRGITATLMGDNERAVELISRVLAAPETTTGIDYLLHHAYFEAVVTRLVMRDIQGARATIQRAYEHLAQHPSAWHSALCMRMESFLLLATSQFTEARQKAETTVSTFTLMGDVVQIAFSKANVAMVARAMGAPDAEARLAEVMAELTRLGVWSPQLARRAQIISQPAPADSWRPETLIERLVGAIERLSVRGLSADQYRRGLAILLGELFPGREAIVGGREVPVAQGGMLEAADGAIRFGVRGELSPEEHAALRILAAFVPRVLGTVAGSEPEPAPDRILPHFIAAAPATRKLKTEIARLSRSSATILIGG
jgi:transcriptional regulator with XRE-family HTH domain